MAQNGKAMENPKPADQAEAEELAKAAISRYLDSCRMAGPENFSNYLTMLVSAAGCLMACHQGSERAAHRLMDCAEFVLHNMPAEPAGIERATAAIRGH